VIIVGGNSDFMPVAQKIKAAGRTLVGLGARNSTNRHWAKSCHEFRHYENLVDPPHASEPDSADVPGQSEVIEALLTHGSPLVSASRESALQFAANPHGCLL